MINKKIVVNKNNVSRRKFLQGGVVLGTAFGLSSLTGKKSTEDIAKAIGKKELDSFPHEINSDFKRFDINKTSITRGKIGEPVMLELLAGLPGYGNVFDDSKAGWTTLDYALYHGATSVNVDFGGNYGGLTNSPLYTWDKKPVEHKYKFTTKEDASKAIKRAAKFYGADLVGITSYDEKWVYDPAGAVLNEKGQLKIINDSDFPFHPKSVIVMAFEEDYEGISTAPSLIEEATTSLIYSKMAEVNYKLSTFIRELGYNAFGAGNDIAMSVPYAIAAGLGEQGRQGLLLTYEYGPRVRLCKVFTEMELVYDKPIEFGANKFCQVCKKCAYSCPSQSISTDDEMTWKGVGYETISNQTGVKKYYVNVDTCYVYWNTCGSSCGVCVSSCPFNKPDFWHHRITTALTSTPLKPFLNEMDDIFGYGNAFDEQACINFWNLETYTK